MLFQSSLLGGKFISALGVGLLCGMNDVHHHPQYPSALGVGLDLEGHDIHHLLAVTSVRSIPQMMCLHLWLYAA